jgi:hypothetical protein
MSDAGTASQVHDIEFLQSIALVPASLCREAVSAHPMTSNAKFAANGQVRSGGANSSEAATRFSTPSYTMGAIDVDSRGRFSDVISKGHCSRHRAFFLRLQPSLCSSSPAFPLGASGKAALPERYGRVGQQENRGLSFEGRALVWSNKRGRLRMPQRGRC